MPATPAAARTRPPRVRDQRTSQRLAAFQAEVQALEHDRAWSADGQGMNMFRPEQLSDLRLGERTRRIFPRGRPALRAGRGHAASRARARDPATCAGQRRRSPRGDHVRRRNGRRIGASLCCRGEPSGDLFEGLVHGVNRCRRANARWSFAARGSRTASTRSTRSLARLAAWRAGATARTPRAEHCCCPSR